MGASGCRGTQGTKKKRKRGLSGREGHVLGRVVTVAKRGKGTGMVGVTREDHGRVRSGNKGCSEQN